MIRVAVINNSDIDSICEEMKYTVDFYKNTIKRVSEDTAELIEYNLDIVNSMKQCISDKDVPGVRKLINSVKISEKGTGDSCFYFVAKLKAYFDYFSIKDYKIYLGSAFFSKKDSIEFLKKIVKTDLNYFIITHTWIEYKNKNYEILRTDGNNYSVKLKVGYFDNNLKFHDDIKEIGPIKSDNKN